MCDKRLLDKIKEEKEENLKGPLKLINSKLRHNKKILQFDVIDFTRVYANLNMQSPSVTADDFIDVTPMFLLRNHFNMYIPR